MIGTDRYAYNSKLKNTDPLTKLIIGVGVMILCIALDSVWVSLLTIFSMGILNVFLGKHSLVDLYKMFKIPMGFIILGCITIMVGRFPHSKELIAGINIGSWQYGISMESLTSGFGLIAKAMGTISSMYFIAMNTPMTDISIALSQLYVPSLFIEILELVYRFIFVLTDTASNIKIAQNSRLGYIDLKTSYKSLATMISMVFVTSLKKADNMYSALESRGYMGQISTVGTLYTLDMRVSVAGTAVAILQVMVYLFI